MRPISGLGRAEQPIDGYVHDITCYIVSGARFAELSLRALITPPNTLKFPVLGRMGFLDQVDVTLVEFEKMLYLRFRNPALQRIFDSNEA